MYTHVYTYVKCSSKVLFTTILNSLLNQCVIRVVNQFLGELLKNMTGRNRKRSAVGWNNKALLFSFTITTAFCKVCTTLLEFLIKCRKRGLNAKYQEFCMNDDGLRVSSKMACVKEQQTE